MAIVRRSREQRALSMPQIALGIDAAYGAGAVQKVGRIVQPTRRLLGRAKGTVLHRRAGHDRDVVLLRNVGHLAHPRRDIVALQRRTLSHAVPRAVRRASEKVLGEDDHIGSLRCGLFGQRSQLGQHIANHAFSRGIGIDLRKHNVQAETLLLRPGAVHKRALHRNGHGGGGRAHRDRV